jgi:hypothetical protein
MVWLMMSRISKRKLMSGLGKQLGSNDAEISAKAAKTLNRLGVKIRPYVLDIVSSVIKAVENGDPDTRMNVYGILKLIRQEDGLRDDTLTALGCIAQDDNENDLLRIAVLSEIARYGKKALPLCKQMLDAESWVKQKAGMSLAASLGPVARPLREDVAALTKVAELKDDQQAYQLGRYAIGKMTSGKEPINTNIVSVYGFVEAFMLFFAGLIVTMVVIWWRPFGTLGMGYKVLLSIAAFAVWIALYQLPSRALEAYFGPSAPMQVFTGTGIALMIFLIIGAAIGTWYYPLSALHLGWKILLTVCSLLVALSFGMFASRIIRGRYIEDFD